MPTTTASKEKFPLPKARITYLQPPLRKATGGWIPQTFDARLRRHGITWLRVKDGFGGRGDREDWVADIPLFCLSVSDFQWKDKASGFWDYHSLEEAMIGELAEHRMEVQQEVEKLRRELKQAESVVKLLAKLKLPHGRKTKP